MLSHSLSTDHHVLDHCISKINVIEFQKRSKPHSDILFHLEDSDKTKTASYIDLIDSAEIPDSLLFPDLRQIVPSCTMHGPCGDTFNIIDAVCMKDGICTKDIPKVCFAYHFQQKVLAHIESLLQSSSNTLVHHRLPVVDQNAVPSDGPPLDPWLHVAMQATLTQGQHALREAIVDAH